MLGIKTHEPFTKGALLCTPQNRFVWNLYGVTLCNFIIYLLSLALFLILDPITVAIIQYLVLIILYFCYRACMCAY